VGVALLAKGHVLIEDVPGTGKTTLARAFAKACAIDFSRIQFTSDMLPSDILGVQLLESQNNTLVFKPGPIFSQLVLADEVNRASPRTQSALLEAMADNQVSVDDETHALPEVFCVIATQNPVEQYGTFPLPESQLDRFAISVTLGYPSADDEAALISGHRGTNAWLEQVSPVLDAESLLASQKRVEKVTIAPNVARYIVDLAHATRNHPSLSLGISPRGVLSMSSLCRARAWLHERAFVTPDDVKVLVPSVFTHRLQTRGSSDERSSILQEILQSCAVPRS